MGNIHAFDLDSNFVHVEVSGAGNADLRVSDTLDATVSGSASINYIGEPIISQSVSGVANIKKVE